MSHDQNPEQQPESPVAKKAQEVGNDSAMAMELPFTFAGAVLLGGGLGYLVDRWMHTKPIFMLIFGVLGFIAGIREVIRRLPAK